MPVLVKASQTNNGVFKIIVGCKNLNNDAVLRCFNGNLFLKKFIHKKGLEKITQHASLKQAHLQPVSLECVHNRSAVAEAVLPNLPEYVVLSLLQRRGEELVLQTPNSSENAVFAVFGGRYEKDVSLARQVS